MAGDLLKANPTPAKAAAGRQQMAVCADDIAGT